MGNKYARLISLAVPLGILAAIVGLVIGGSIEQVEAGLPNPGSFVRYGLPVSRTVQDLTAAATVGLLVLAACVIPPATQSVKNDLVGLRARAVRFAAITSTAWLLSGALTLVLTYADVAGISPSSPGFTSQLGFFIRSFDIGRSMVAMLVIAAAVSIGTIVATRITTVGWLALGSVFALLPLALSGHVAGSQDHQTAVDSLAIHLVAVSIWAGGLTALVLLSPWMRENLGVSARRYSTLAGWCFALVAGSGLVNAWLRVGHWSGLATAYGVLVLVKAAALLLLGFAGWRHRRVLLPRIDGGDAPRRAFLRLATAEVLLMGTTIGVAVALSRSAPPVSQTTVTSGDPVAALLGFDLPGAMTVSHLLTTFYVEPIWLLVAVLAAAWYLVSVQRLRRRGDSWPVGRTISWVVGCVLLAWVTSGGPGVFGRVSFAGHMLQHMLLMMVVPLPLVLGSPVTLALRTLTARRDGSRGPREWLLEVVHSRVVRLLTYPAVAAALFVGSLVVFYYSPLFSVALSTHSGHMLMTLHFLLVGYLFSWVLVGSDPGPPRAPYPLRLVVLLATISFHAFFGIALMMSSAVLAPDWWASLGLHNTAALLADQHTGGAIAWSVGEIPTLILTLVVAITWSRADDRLAARSDRQADRDGDAELAAYNRRLAHLSARDDRDADGPSR
jgi:cytochrome c oxidase assembly factor CtaG